MWIIQDQTEGDTSVVGQNLQYPYDLEIVTVLIVSKFWTRLNHCWWQTSLSVMLMTLG